MSYAVFLLLFNLYLSTWIGVYLFTARKKQTFNFNRYVLIGGVLCAILLPFASIIHFSTEAGTSLAALPSFNEVSEIGSTQANELTAHHYPLWKFIVPIYWAGAAVMCLRLLKDTIKLISIYFQGKRVKHTNYTQVITGDDTAPFSFLGCLFGPMDMSNSAFEHEQVHIQQKHSLDNLLMEFIKIFSWFNPLVYRYHKEIRINHEYIADKETLKKVDVVEYSEELVSQAFQIPRSTLVQPFNSNSQIKNRLIMLKNRNNSTKKAWTYGMFVPALAVVVFLSSSFSWQDKLENTIEKIKPLEVEIVTPPTAQQEDNAVSTLPTVVTGDTLEANYKGGSKAMMEYIAKNMVYPKSEIDNGNSGVVYGKITIGVDGKIEKVEILRGVSKGIDKEATRVLKEMPAWEPATVDGKPISSTAIIPIRFALQ